MSVLLLAQIDTMLQYSIAHVSGVICIVVSWIFSLGHSMVSGRYASQVTSDNLRGKIYGICLRTELCKRTISACFWTVFLSYVLPITCYSTCQKIILLSKRLDMWDTLYSPTDPGVYLLDCIIHQFIHHSTIMDLSFNMH
jgi:hypothetical protein